MWRPECKYRFIYVVIVILPPLYSNGEVPVLRLHLCGGSALAAVSRDDRKTLLGSFFVASQVL